MNVRRWFQPKPLSAGTRRHLVVIATVAGLMLLVSGATANTGLYRLGYQVLVGWLPFLEPLLVVVLAVVSVLAALGGVTVLAGTYAYHKGSRMAGKVLVTLGTGTGILGVGLHLLLVVVTGNDPVRTLLGIGSSLSGLGLLLTIYVRVRM